MGPAHILSVTSSTTVLFILLPFFLHTPTHLHTHIRFYPRPSKPTTMQSIVLTALLALGATLPALTAAAFNESEMYPSLPPPPPSHACNVRC